MDYSVLFLILILTTTQTTLLHHHCNSDVYSSASGMDDLQQPTTLQYCLIDNCTIIRIDTGQQLDIVYTTQSLLVVTPTDGQTSLLISKNEPELFCSTNHSIGHFFSQVIRIILIILPILVSGYIALVHLIFKELRTTFGKLMILYSIGIVSANGNIFGLFITHYYIAVYSTMPCYLFFFLFMQSEMVCEGFATCIIAYLAYVMHRGYKSRSLTKELDKKLHKYSIRYVLGSLLLFNIFIVSYDFGTGKFEHVILPNGHCSFINPTEYDTIEIAHANNAINKVTQIILLVVYFIYYYKLNKMLKMVRNMVANTNQQQNRMFFKIAVAMGATIGISELIFTYNRFVSQITIVGIVGVLSLFIQQCVILILIMCSKKVSRLCKERFCTTETS